MRVGKRIYFDSREERLDFLNVIRNSSDAIETSSIIAERYKLDFAEAMDIAKTYHTYMRKEKQEGN